jgi:uncharacterized glyoxalase superfamily protein PhnB
MRTSVHLTFGGQCETAFRFYERALAGRIVTMLAYRDSPMAGQRASRRGYCADAAPEDVLVTGVWRTG